ncbi:helix-turn-helix transcriptional regulator [uncultured Vagococcus sp.]|uniref:helix-turn-helix transcriptional regulator n=1 Tax=uncultured Vagococcus sp. TaxID=189676 RepID=UPI0028D00239|nr:helix-turn-helix transcriptional regulator [uncultured Vagococcus sp.]
MIKTEADIKVGKGDTRVEVARLLRELREAKHISQEELAKRIGRNRQVVAQMERGVSQGINLLRLEEMVAACGERLVLATTKQKKEIPLDTYQEDQVLVAFASGEIGEAERRLSGLRRWQYPVTQVMACCKRDMAVTLSYYFKGRTDLSHSEMNNITMGLSLIGFVKEAVALKELYNDILDQAEELMNGGEAS